ncbi:hypothetical protein HYW74_02455 [Candidatus Pacearchaeota archaeon]|nr:hypothetical protein [Candidatus Pacearchaeota archaeon]MBI4157116.1 hypothetical protein [Candidatus Woesearchaeota archaeon]
MAENRFRENLNEYAINFLFAGILYAAFFSFVFPKIMNGMINYGYEIFPEVKAHKIAEDGRKEEEVNRKKVNELEDILTSMAELDLERNLGILSEKSREEYAKLHKELEFYK